MWLPLQTCFYSATAAAVVQSRRYMNVVQCIISRHFMCDKKVSCTFVPPRATVLDAISYEARCSSCGTNCEYRGPNANDETSKVDFGNCMLMLLFLCCDSRFAAV